MTGLDVFDKPVLSQQCIDFAFALHVVDVSDFVDPLSCAQFFSCRGLEITPSPGSQVFGFTDVYHHPGCIFHQVDTWRLRKFTNFFG